MMGENGYINGISQDKQHDKEKKNHGVTRKCKFLLQLDITRPGVNILRAWSPAATTAISEYSVDYNIICGSMVLSCPHVSAAAVILKSYQSL